MLHSVVLDSGGEFDLIGIGGYHLDDLIGAYSSVVELAARPSGSDVLCIEPNSIPNPERRCRFPFAVRLVLVPMLCP